MSKLQDAFFITVITLMLVGTVAINKAQASDLKHNPVQNPSHQTVHAPKYQPIKSETSFSKIGKASWYGSGFHGKKTSSGERFNMHGLTAAHRTLPFGTQVRITNLANGKSVIVRINDRGPFHGNRMIDVSKGAASKLGFIQNGMATVKLETLNKPSDAIDIVGAKTNILKKLLPETQQSFTAAPAQSFGLLSSHSLFWDIQNFSNEHDARHFMLKTFHQLQQMNKPYPVDMIKQNGGYIVRIGPFENAQHLNHTQNQLSLL